MHHPSCDIVDELTPKNDEAIFDNLFCGEADSSREKNGDPAYFFDFPSPLFDYVDIDTFILQEHQDQLSFGGCTVADSVSKLQEDAGCREGTNGGGHQESTKTTCTPTRKETNIKRKRSSRKERHSKINTAQGLRNRRMRLSVEVARKFFALQDMLGFNKASKTIEWLLLKAKDEVEKLATGSAHFNYGYNNGAIAAIAAKSASSTTKRELVLVNDESKVDRSFTKKKGRKPRNFAAKSIKRELREKARERARERTKWKMQSQRFKAMGDYGGRKDSQVNMSFHSRSHSLLEAGNKEVGEQCYCMNLSSKEIQEAGDTNDGKGSQSSAFSDLNSPMDPREIRIKDVQCSPKAKDAFN